MSIKIRLHSIFCLLLTTLLTLSGIHQTIAQAASGLTAEQVTAIKTIKIPNIEKDTYLKINGFILDRYEERPAYVFNYTDGIVRKIYLYKLFDAASTNQLGLVAYYVNGKTGAVKPFVIPGANANRKAWDVYIDDLKYVGEKEPGLMSTLTFALSRELATLLSGDTGKADDGGNKKKEEYNFCFAANAPVSLAHGSEKAISQLQIGEQVNSYDAVTKTIMPSPITRIDTHRQADGFALMGIWVVSTQPVTAGLTASASPELLEATANHPVLTTTGRKAIGDLKPGDLLYRYEAATNTTSTVRVVRVEPTRTVNTVYTIATQNGNYLIENVVVLNK